MATQPRLTTDEVNDIRLLALHGLKRKEIAEIFNVSLPLVTYYTNHQQRSDVIYEVIHLVRHKLKSDTALALLHTTEQEAA
jgi:predicted DNA-binding protein (UPF0251 family)